jgi:enolase
MFQLASVRALEILDSRGRPTLQTTCELRSGFIGCASVPSGASTGAAESLELRDGDPARYGGLGVRKAVARVNKTINEALRGGIFPHQAALDQTMLELDGTPNKVNLGANAILSVSLAFARAAAHQLGVPLYRYFAVQYATQEGIEREETPGPSSGLHATTDIQSGLHATANIESWPHAAPNRLPRPTINLFSGGKHAGGQIAIQDVLIVPAAASVADALADTYAVYQAAARLCETKYYMRALSADEGGLAPPFPDTETMLADACQAIEDAGLTPGRDVFLAVDVASSHFYHEGVYHLDGARLTSQEMAARLLAWVEQYPIVSVEDGLAEDDWAHWPGLRAALADRALVLGDDFLCTNPARIQRAIEAQAANALLLKVNQIGTLTEAAEACRLARAAGWAVTISARSGETEDNWLADLAVGWGGDQLKVGSITQSERLAKYNRLLAIEAETGWPVADWPVSDKMTR